MVTFVKTSGPLFDGNVDRIMESICAKVTEEVAQQGYDRVQQRLHQVLRHPTGYLQSRIKTDRISPTRASINNGRLVYGPWIEGTGSRNRTTRFKGYHTFRIVTQDLDAVAGEIAAKIIAREIGRLN
jgi:hypothetical protein